MTPNSAQARIKLTYQKSDLKTLKREREGREREKERERESAHVWEHTTLGT